MAQPDRDDDDPATPTANPVVREARRRFQRAKAFESHSRNLFLEDIKFANADSDNGYQWPNDIRRNRDADKRPCLTINKVAQHNLQIINDMKQNKPGIKYVATGGGASYESAQILNALARHVEYQSNAQAAYDTAAEFQVQAGIGYWRLATDYAGDDTLDQEIYIRRIPDPLKVYTDPDAKEKDKSDMQWGFIFDDIPKDQFDDLYPKYKGQSYARQAALGNEDSWVGKDHIRVAEYFRIVQEDDKLLSFIDPRTGQRAIVKASRLPRELRSLVADSPDTRKRSIKDTTVEWYLIIGHQIAEKGTWPGRYVPIIPCLGIETLIDGQLDRKGHTRAMKDAQRTYNYWTSAGVEFGALQSKVPYVAPAAAVEEYEEFWKTANTVNHAYLPFKHLDEEGNQIPPPTRQQPPVQADLYLKGMAIAQQEMMFVSGQYEAQMGQQTYERSGKAIQERQRQGDNATYHFIDHQALAIRNTGRQLLDLIPKVYDTRRVINVLAEDGTDFEVEVDPQAAQAFIAHVNHNNEVARRIFNPKVGRYEVQADIGPSYGTKRQEAFNAFVQIITQAPNLVGIIGDLLLRSADFPMADEAAIRLKRMLPRQALGLGPTASEQQLGAQVQQLQSLLQKALDAHAQDKVKLRGKEQMRDIDAYKAMTERIGTLLKTATDIQSLRQAWMQLGHDILATHINATTASAEGAEGALAPKPDTGPLEAFGQQLGLPLGDQPPLPGARQAGDGKWYLPDRTRPGHFLYVTKG